MTNLISPEMWGKEAKFLPWSALNEFMVDNFRAAVVRKALTEMHKVGGKHRGVIQNRVRKLARVPGFRDAVRAPLPLQVIPTAQVFIKDNDLVGSVLAVWTAAQPELRDSVHAFLAARDWQLLPADVDRTVIPGWLLEWPESTDLQTLGEEYIADGHEDVERDDACLMICWIAGRLPVEMPEDDEEDATEADEDAAEDAAE